MGKVKFRGFLFGLFALAVNTLFGVLPQLAESVYYRSVFQLIRVAYDYTLGLLPIPMVYVLFVVLVWIIAQMLGTLWDALTTKQPIVIRVLHSLLAIVNPVGWVLFFFYFLWGWNYQKTSFEERMDFRHITADTTVLIEETRVVMNLIDQERSALLADTAHFTFDLLPEDLEGILRDGQEKLLRVWGEPTYGRVRIRELRPSGLLLRISTAGVYIPFVCEGHIDAGLHSLQYPFTMAHEMAHGYGYTDEGVCNFIGYITCRQSDNATIKYAGLVGYWRYLLSNVRTEAPHSYRILRSNIPRSIRTDLNDIADQMDKYPDVMPKVRNAVYDTYLKSHGVKQGIANYNDIVRLVAQWKEKQRRQ